MTGQPRPARLRTPVLTALAALLAVNAVALLAPMAGSPPAAALALQPLNPPPTPFPNQSENTRKLIEQMAEVNARLARLEAKLDKPLQVKVTEMPPVVVSNPTAQAKPDQ